MIGVDCCVRRDDVTQDRCVIAKDKIRQIRPDLSAFSSLAVAFGTGDLVTKEQTLSMQPITAGNFGNLPFEFIRLVFCLWPGPGEEDASQRQRARARIICGMPCDLQVWLTLAGFKHHFDRQPMIALGFEGKFLRFGCGCGFGIFGFESEGSG